MDRDELLKMLDIKPEATKPTKVTMGVDKASGKDKTVHTKLSPYAMKLDEWDVEQGRRCLVENHSMEMSGLTIAEAADFHAVYFHQRPSLIDDDTACTDPQRVEFLRGVMDTPEYRSLHQQTRANPPASMIAASELAGAFLRRSDRKRDKDGTEPVQAPENRPQEPTGDIGDALAIGKAIADAQQQVDELRQMSLAFGCGDEDAQNGSADIGSVQRQFARVKDNPMLRQVIELAGRYRRCAQAKQRTKADHGYDDMVGVEMDGDIGRLLPVELVMLADEDFEMDAMRRLVERQSACRQFRGMENQAKGPIVVCVDESGSMRKEGRIEEAKAFALAMAWVARHQNRSIALVGYSVNKEGNVCVLPPGKWDQEALLNWLEHFYKGGTSMECPLRTVPFDYWNKVKGGQGKTDMILITDGVVQVDPRTRDRFNQWKAENDVKCHTIIIGDLDQGELGSISDELHEVMTFGLHEQAVSDCLAI